MGPFALCQNNKGMPCACLGVMPALGSHELLRMIVAQKVAIKLCRFDFLCVHISARMQLCLRCFEINSLEIKNSLGNVGHLNLRVTRTETTSEICLINMQCRHTEIDMRNCHVNEN